MLYSIDEIREALRDRKIAVVAEKTGITRAAIYNIMNKGAVPGFKIYEKLVTYLFGDK